MTFNLIADITNKYSETSNIYENEAYHLSNIIITIEFTVI